jgi:hypothetical protein
MTTAGDYWHDPAQPFWPDADGELPPDPPPWNPTGDDPETAREVDYDYQRQLKLARTVENEEIAREAEAIVKQRHQEEPPGAGARKLRLTKASEFKIKRVEWLWDGRVPVGEITLIPGREGVGKSTFLAWLATAITRGQLPGRWFGTKRAVLYAATEDSWEHTIAPRLVAAGADLDLVYRVDVEVEEGRFGKLLLPVDSAKLAELALSADVEVGALLCDPIISLISDEINTFKAQELRRALEPLRTAAERGGFAVAALVHFNKGKDNDVLTAISGSRGWVEVARAVIAIARDPDAEQYTCVVSQVKNNLGRSDLTNLAYTIESHTVDTYDGLQAEVGRLAWTSQAYARGVEDILSPPKEDRSHSEAVNAVLVFINERYAETGHPVKAAEIMQRLGGAHGEPALRKILSRQASSGTLRRMGQGLYLPANPFRPCPGCGKALDEGRNFCPACSRDLDRADRQTAMEF